MKIGLHILIIIPQSSKIFPDGSRFVEVGCWRVRSACFLGVEIYNSVKNISLDCVDTWNGSEEHIGYEM